ncbi:MAG: PqqD family protein [Lachnospiraceae bacterium]|nr:PqqD family protein [Lachnospiraceae bacterium]
MAYSSKNPASGRYQLRKAAGRYWLLDMEQPGFPYIPPVVINEGGAFIWQSLADGLSVKFIAEKLVMEYDIPEEEARQDITEFINQLIKQGVSCKGLIEGQKD